jgi:hypothetical protein
VHRALLTSVSLAGFALFCAGPASVAQMPPSTEPVFRRCFQFDRAYFRWNTLTAAGDIVVDSSAILALDTMPHPGLAQNLNPAARRVDPLMPRANAFSEKWLDYSMWRMRKDTTEVVWYNGGAGLRFRFVGVDTVFARGTKEILGDLAQVDTFGRLQALEPAVQNVARIVACPK